MGEEKCNMILADSKLIADHGFKPLYGDLFLESLGFCGLAGYKEFFTRNWFEKIVSWQKPSGCFGMKLNFTSEDFFETTKYHAAKSRVRRYEKIVDAECAIHQSAAAALALVGYVRFFIEDSIDEK